MRPVNLLLWLVVIGVAASGGLAADTPVSGSPALRIATWGGAYEAVQRQVLFDPFTRETGIRIETVPYTGGLAILDSEAPDLVDMSMVEALAACRAGSLRLLDLDDLAPSEEGRPPREDFVPGSLRPCSIAHTVYATVIAYDSRAFVGHRPTKVADLFNLTEFPGPRALQASPYANLEWALMSYGVPRREIYDLLSTRRGLDLAFERLDSLTGQLYWWRDGETPVELLESGQVTMASGYNGRFFSAQVDHDSPIEILWDGQLQERQAWVIPKRARSPEAAWAFIRYATTTGKMAAIANHIAYGPTRRSASLLIGRHPVSGVDMRPHIPTHPYNAGSAIQKDVFWYASIYHRVRERFERWYDRVTDQEKEQ